MKSHIYGKVIKNLMKMPLEPKEEAPVEAPHHGMTITIATGKPGHPDIPAPVKGAMPEMEPDEDDMPPMGQSKKKNPFKK